MPDAHGGSVLQANPATGAVVWTADLRSLHDVGDEVDLVVSDPFVVDGEVRVSSVPEGQEDAPWHLLTEIDAETGAVGRAGSIGGRLVAVRRDISVAHGRTAEGELTLSAAGPVR